MSTKTFSLWLINRHRDHLATSDDPTPLFAFLNMATILQQVSAPAGAFSNATQPTLTSSKKVERWARGLLRFPELLFQLLHKLSQALICDGIVAQASRPLGLFQPSLQFFSVALFIHGDTPSFVRRGSDAMVHIS
jgi:hypothetical protein